METALPFLFITWWTEHQFTQSSPNVLQVLCINVPTGQSLYSSAVTLKWPSQQRRQGKAFQTDSTHLMPSERADTVKKCFFIQGKMEYICQVPHGCPWGCAWVQGTQRGPEINCLLMHGCNVTVWHPNQKQALFLSKQISDVYMKGRKGKKLTGWTGQGSGHWSLG